MATYDDKQTTHRCSIVEDEEDFDDEVAAAVLNSPENYQTASTRRSTFMEKLKGCTMGISCRKNPQKYNSSDKLKA